MHVYKMKMKTPCLCVYRGTGTSSPVATAIPRERFLSVLSLLTSIRREYGIDTARQTLVQRSEEE
jgi:hypothetical protein